MIALQLVGSPTSNFFFNLSLLYAKDVIRPKEFDLLFAIAYPDGQWSVSKSIDERSEKITFTEMIKLVKKSDICVPHMFCDKGLTSLRIFFEKILEIPLVGSSGHTMKIAQDKYLTKLICADAGVPVPHGIKMTSSDMDRFSGQSIKYPLIIKPNCADNSDGISLIKTQNELEKGLEKAFTFDKEILMETYIPGREIRGAVIKKNGSFDILPFIEYGVNEDNPIRNPEDKLKFDKDGRIIGQSEKLKVPAQCPAKLEANLKTDLSRHMIACHKALNCRDFSMYDFRIHEASGKPYVLEAGLFWSFSPKSMISSMLSADGTRLQDITHALWMQTLLRGST